MKFEDMKFNEKIKKAIKEMKYENATEVQEKSIPIIINGDNLICKSFTGSGKTAAFGIGVSERLLNGKTNGVLIIGPTRELVVQVKEELHKINKYSGLKVNVVYGGHGMMQEVQSIRKGVDILVATPGRLLDHIKQGVIKKDFFNTVVLDEADRMLDMGFIDDLNKIMEFFKPRNTMLFSATLEQEIVKLIHKYIPNYKEVMVHTEIVGTNIIEKNIDMEMRDKFLYLLEIVKKAEGKRVLVFVSTKKDAENVERKLGKSGYFAASIHGDKSQKFREQSLKDFKSGKTNILVATDVAARGLQIDNVEFVVNYDNARDKDTHKHRIGRTGRMGATGYAINFITPDDAYKNARRDGKRAVRSNHSIDNKGTNVWDLVNKSRHFDGNRDHRFGNRNRDRTNARSGRREFRENFNVELNDSPKEPKAENVLLHLEKSEHKETRSENKHEQNEIERPKRSFDDRDRKPFRDKRSRDSPRRDFGDKPRFGRDKPSFGKRHSIDGPDNSESKFGDRKRSFGDKPRFSKDGPRRSFGDRDRKSFGDNPSFGKDRPRKSFGRDRESKFDPSDKSKGFESRTYQDRKEGFVPKSFRRDKEYMNSRPEYRNKDKEDTKDKHKDKKQNLKKGRNLKFQGRFPRKSF